MPWRRAALVWMLIMLAETGHGVIRELFIAPVIGGLRARQLGVFVGCVIIFVIAWLTARWMGARHAASNSRWARSGSRSRWCLKSRSGRAIGAELGAHPRGLQSARKADS